MVMRFAKKSNVLPERHTVRDTVPDNRPVEAGKSGITPRSPRPLDFLPPRPGHVNKAVDGLPVKLLYRHAVHQDFFAGTLQPHPVTLLQPGDAPVMLSADPEQKTVTLPLHPAGDHNQAAQR